MRTGPHTLDIFYSVCTPVLATGQRENTEGVLRMNRFVVTCMLGTALALSVGCAGTRAKSTLPDAPPPDADAKRNVEAGDVVQVRVYEGAHRTVSSWD